MLYCVGVAVCGTAGGAGRHTGRTDWGALILQGQGPGRLHGGRHLQTRLLYVSAALSTIPRVCWFSVIWSILTCYTPRPLLVEEIKGNST